DVEATANVDEDGGDVGLDLRADRAVRRDRRGRQARRSRDDAFTSTQLEHDRRLQRERPRRESRVDADRVTIFRGTRLPGREGGGGVAATTALPRATGRGTLALEVRVNRLDVQALEGREPEADDARPVFTTDEAVPRPRQGFFHLNVGQVQRRGRGDVERER